MYRHLLVLGFTIYLLTTLSFASKAQDNNQPKIVKHVLWINIPGLSKAAMDSSNCKNIKFIAKKSLANYQVETGKSPIKELLFSCDGKNIMQALEENNSTVKTAAYVASKDLYKRLSDLGIDEVKNGKNDIELTEWAYEALRNERPNFLFVNLSGIESSLSRGNKIGSDDFSRAVSEVDVMVSGIFKGLIESRLYGKTAIIISSYSDEQNAVLFIQADNLVEAKIIDDKVSLNQLLPTINELVGKVPGFNCEASSLVEIN